jgi:sialic acid synthase SpsE
MKIKIGKNIIISKKTRTLIIAEISANHCGSKSNFLKHIIEAKKNGADFVKIQTYEPEDMIINKKFIIKQGLWKKINLWNLYKKAQTPFSWHKDAFKIAKKNKIELFSTPFSVRALNFLKKFQPNLYKISSFEITDHNLITEIAKTKKPIIISTGLSNMKEIIIALKIIKKYHSKIIVLYCVSGYPTPIHEINFKRINEIKKATGINLIGFSDHTVGIDASIASLKHDVRVIERHFTLNKSSKSPDAKFSIGPKELENLKRITQSFDLINNKNKKVKAFSEKPSQIFRRSIYAIKDIKKNEKFKTSNIGCFRPKIGIGADNYFKILGKKSKVNIKKNKVLKLNFFK